MRLSLGRSLLALLIVAVGMIILMTMLGSRLGQLFTNLAPNSQLAPPEPPGPTRGLQAIAPPTSRPEATIPSLPTQPRASPTSRPPTATPAPTRQQVRGQVLALVEAGQIEVRSTGQSIDQLQLELRSEIDADIEVEIPAGVFFLAQTAGIQNMVVRHTRTVYLTDNEWVSALLEAACASIHLDVPGAEHGFRILAQPNEADIAQLMPVLDATRPPYAVEQAAVWIVSDDANYDDLGTLVGGWVTMTRLIHENETVRALQLLDKAGIDLTLYRIWRDRNRLLEGVTEPTLRQWLANR